jgi:hypothetical protein
MFNAAQTLCHVIYLSPFSFSRNETSYWRDAGNSYDPIESKVCPLFIFMHRTILILICIPLWKLPCLTDVLSVCVTAEFGLPHDTRCGRGGFPDPRWVPDSIFFLVLVGESIQIGQRTENTGLSGCIKSWCVAEANSFRTKYFFIGTKTPSQSRDSSYVTTSTDNPHGKIIDSMGRNVGWSLSYCYVWPLRRIDVIDGRLQKGRSGSKQG